MPNRYCNLPPAVPIKDSFPQIDAGFAAVQDDLDNMPFNMARQAIINGNFDVAQRGTSFVNPTNGGFLLDHWATFYTADGGVLPTTVTHSQQKLSPGDIPNSYFFDRTNVNGAGSGFGVSAYYFKGQKIEHGTRYLCGAGKKVTVSFWARSDIPGKRIAVAIQQTYGSGGSPTVGEALTTSGQIITLSAVWTRYSFTFTTNTLAGKTFGTNNDDYLWVRIFSMWGTTTATSYLGGGTAETFVGAGNIDIIQVQVCAGDVALLYQPRTFGEELALCQRYYEKSYDLGVSISSATGIGEVYYSTRRAVAASTSGVLVNTVPFKVRKRIPPTVKLYSPSGTANALRVDNVNDRTGATAGTIGDSGFAQVNLDSTSATTVGLDSLIEYQWTADAEL
ncbi:carbohydrate binding domain-containing protein [Cohnella luojiensis]|uniref:CBM-cenC domain-containing protein n=1 Tax=Cohnella luojiensis TaxID=652876 RepID=A0A4Y8MB39_9BACL|nr:carbohydrate binding domain-containing protein [Cohnella luojiensis]TFE30843.1 hypothetical protein E2980_03440 [Cohnella luojiensis]